MNGASPFPFGACVRTQSVDEDFPRECVTAPRNAVSAYLSVMADGFSRAGGTRVRRTRRHARKPADRHARRDPPLGGRCGIT
ncbi:hypothetical protein [Saccharothrix sp. HUAS TT1]|uniref:hypothetical protein n=1 Tax=unclassified Saccharothrix TaxID=2593673 RepID=UPI00345BC8CF